MMIVTLSLLFLGSSQPMIMVLMLMIVTFLFSVWLYIETMTFWYGFVMILVIVSGVMVVFTYMASMVPNEKFDIVWIALSLVIILVTSMKSYFCELNSSIFSVKLWHCTVMYVNLFMVGFLFVIMLEVVWMSDWMKGSVRF